VATTSQRRWKGCRLCKMHKHKGCGAARVPWAVKRQLGKANRLNKNNLPV
jgi:hypothetical protein